MNVIRTIALDADDTLWVNEPFFREAEHKFCALLKEYMPMEELEKKLLDIEIANLPLYGYGIKAFMLSMIETAYHITDGKVDNAVIRSCIEVGKEMLAKPLELIDGVEDVVKSLSKKYRLVLATKGDLVDQERKLDKSGLSEYFHHIEVMSEKKEVNYKRLIRHLDCELSDFLMVGNSLKSDVLPVLELGGYSIHIPFHTTWEYEKVDVKIDNPRFAQLDSIKDIEQAISTF